MRYNIDIDYVSGVYDIRDDGTIRNLSDGDVVFTSVRNGYRHVRLRSVRLTVPVGLLVALRYIGAAPSDDSVVRHLDGNRLNDRAENLAWSTHGEIIRATYEAGRRPYWKGRKRGAYSDETRAKMAEKKNKRVVCDDEEYPSIEAVLPVLGVSRKTFNRLIGSGVIRGHKVYVLGLLVSERSRVKTSKVMVYPIAPSEAYSLEDIEKGYEIHPDGTVFSKRAGTILKPVDTGMSVIYNLRVRWYNVQVSAARVVAMKYVSPISGKREVGHKDNNYYNNNADNLVWMSRSEVRLKGNNPDYWWKDNRKLNN